MVKEKGQSKNEDQHPPKHGFGHTEYLRATHAYVSHLYVHTKARTTHFALMRILFTCTLLIIVAFICALFGFVWFLVPPKFMAVTFSRSLFEVLSSLESNTISGMIISPKKLMHNTNHRNLLLLQMPNMLSSALLLVCSLTISHAFLLRPSIPKTTIHTPTHTATETSVTTMASSSSSGSTSFQGMKQVLFKQIGCGGDQHGQEATKAAVKACRNAIEFNSLPSIKQIVPGGYEGMKLRVELAVPVEKHQIDEEQVCLCECGFV